MNAREAFPGTGIRAGTPHDINTSLEADIAADDTFADAVQGALSEPIPAATPTDKDRNIFTRQIAARRAEKLKQQAIVAEAQGKIRALTVSIRSMEDALDGLLVAEA